MCISYVYNYDHLSVFACVCPYVCRGEIKGALRLCSISLWFHREFKFTAAESRKKKSEVLIKARSRQNGEYA